MPLVPTVATDVDPEVHIPPLGKSLYDVVEPAQISLDPDIPPGCWLTVTTCVAVHAKSGVVYVIMLVPGATPVIVPELEPTVTKVLLLLHVPPVTPALKPNVVDDVPHTLDVPVITGSAFSVTTAVAVQPAPGVV